MSESFGIKVVIELPVASVGTTLTLTPKQAGELYDQLGEMFGVEIHEQLGISPVYPPGWKTPNVYPDAPVYPTCSQVTQ